MVFKNTNLYFRQFLFPGDNTNFYYRVDKQQCFNYPRCIYGLYATADILLARLGQKNNWKSLLSLET
jgi:hypothetical protein